MNFREEWKTNTCGMDKLTKAILFCMGMCMVAAILSVT
jgi:hypothetical protein